MQQDKAKKIVVIGGSGLIGAKLVKKLLRLGHIVISASPTSGVNTVTGEGLKETLKNATVVVDVSNPPVFEENVVLDFFQRSTMNLLTAEVYGTVKHHVALSVVGADRLPDSGYYRAKMAQEDLIRYSGVPFTILRSTQFFEFTGLIAQSAIRGDQIHISSAAFQPIAADEVVAALTDIVLSTPLNTTVEVAGPVRMPLYELIRYYLNATEDSHQLVLNEQALYFGAQLNDGSLVPGNNPRLGKIKYEEWFNTQVIPQHY